jgi:hypothetical protein
MLFQSRQVAAAIAVQVFGESDQVRFGPMIDPVG